MKAVALFVMFLFSTLSFSHPANAGSLSIDHIELSRYENHGHRDCGAECAQTCYSFYQRCVADADGDLSKVFEECDPEYSRCRAMCGLQCQ